MSPISSPLSHPATLADSVAPVRLSLAQRDVLRIALGVAAVTALAQVSVPLPLTPVPLTGQTLGVLLCGLSLGARRGGLALALYLLLGTVGLPVFAGGGAHLSGPTAGYLIAFPVAAALVGYLAERGWDRHPLRSASALCLGGLLILTVGFLWLSLFVGGIASGFQKGMLPFLPVEAVKILLAAGIHPMIWSRFPKTTAVICDTARSD